MLREKQTHWFFMIAARRASLQTEIICQDYLNTDHREQLLQACRLQGVQKGRQGAERDRKSALVSIKSDDLSRRSWRLILVHSCQNWDRLELKNFTALVAHQHDVGVAGNPAGLDFSQKACLQTPKQPVFPKYFYTWRHACDGRRVWLTPVLSQGCSPLTTISSPQQGQKKAENVKLQRRERYAAVCARNGHFEILWEVDLRNKRNYWWLWQAVFPVERIVILKILTCLRLALSRLTFKLFLPRSATLHSICLQCLL